jgi:urea carboxylase
MFAKVLIANRGAVACRVIRTLRRMGIASVAVYSEADVGSLHVRQADFAYYIGPGPASESYLQGERILEVALMAGAQAIHPGYGFLSENAAFAQACTDSGIAFIGPTPEQMRAFGLKHTARALALQEGVALLPGSGLLRDLEHARREAERIGYPVMLKSTAGGGGIGMRLVANGVELAEAYSAVARLARNNFHDAGLFVEKFVEAARHIEVQIFGDGQGGVIDLGERDCSVQRRNQKVIEETPAPGLTEADRAGLTASALKLMRAVDYRSVGTVEFVYDVAASASYFLEVNTRLQVEHGVTEAVTGVDLVEWMVALAAGELPPLETLRPTACGWAIQARVYAEDPARDFQPSTGVLTEVSFPERARIETWIERGTDISGFYDPMLAKIIVKGSERNAAVQELASALEATRIAGITTNLAYLQQIARDPAFGAGRYDTSFLAGLTYRPSTIEVLEAGLQTSIQDWPGRLGHWDVGVPPSGPMDSYAHRIANRLVGNPSDAAAIECTVAGPVLRFHTEVVIALAGAPAQITLDGRALAMGRSHRAEAGSVLAIGRVGETGTRLYLAIGGGIDVPLYLGSRSTFTLGQFGGHGGRTLRMGDVLPLQAPGQGTCGLELGDAALPVYQRHWDLGVLYGPHGAPDFFLDEDIDTFFRTDWQVHHNSSRTGVRLLGPKPRWARSDGGEAGLHPSNIHDNAYAIGAVDFTGDMPVILGPDGPSLGGFVCPAVVVNAELWKLGQLRPGDTVRFHRLSLEEARRREEALEASIATLRSPLPEAPEDDARACPEPILLDRPASENRPRLVYRQAGDRYVLIEYGPLALDLELRLRVHALMSALKMRELPGILDLTPGIRSLQVHFDPAVLSREALLETLKDTEEAIPELDDIVVPSRIVHLPLAWNDSQIQVAIEKYSQSVRADAPWAPSNIEFIRRMNGLSRVEDVQHLFFSARYLVLGLGDVYLGAPVATPADPRHRLVTTKYNPARTWTPENAVGIGGAYLCVYGMEGPGGYQLVGRTVQMWNRWRHGPGGPRDFSQPWLLRFFDQLRFYPVSETELTRMRIDFPLGRMQLKIEETRFSLRDYRAFLAREEPSIQRFKTSQQEAFEAERERWREAGAERPLFEDLGEEPAASGPVDATELPAGMQAIYSPVQGSVWKVLVTEGEFVAAGQVLLVIESMKMEFPLHAITSGRIEHVAVREGAGVGVGQSVMRWRPDSVETRS